MVENTESEVVEWGDDYGRNLTVTVSKKAAVLWKQACGTVLMSVAVCELDTRLSFSPQNSPKVYY